MAIELEKRLKSFGRWMAKAVISPTKRLVLVSSSADEIVLSLRVPWITRGAVDATPSRVGSERVSVRVSGRRLVVRGRRRWAPSRDAGAGRQLSTSAALGSWLPRPFSASFALPFDTDRFHIRTRASGDAVEIRVGRRHESTPLA